MNVYLLKRKARKIYHQIMIEEDQYSCGNHLAEYISPTIYGLKREFNEVMDRLALIDPNTPKARL